MASERRAAIEAAIRAHSDWSNRRIARSIGADHDTVSRLRGEMIARGEIPAQAFVRTRNGRMYYRGPRGDGSRVLLARLSDLRELLGGVGDRSWKRASPDVRREFSAVAAALAERAAS